MGTNKLKLYVDFDSTIVDSIARFVQMANKKYNVEKNSGDLGHYGFKNMYPELSTEELLDIFAKEEFFNNNLKIIDGCLEVLYKYKDIYDICIATACTGDNLKHKKAWVEKNLPFVKEFHSFTTSDKSSLDMSDGIQIDDTYKCLKTNASLKILFKNYKNYEWQRHCNTEVYNVNNWEEIDSILEFCEREGVEW